MPRELPVTRTTLPEKSYRTTLGLQSSKVQRDEENALRYPALWEITSPIDSLSFASDNQAMASV
jgi:hypothetical protein